jgi:hypothetical protein
VKYEEPCWWLVIVEYYGKFPFKSFKPFNRCALFKTFTGKRLKRRRVRRTLVPRWGNFHVSRILETWK